jgi:exodeoxyribonuclease V gamma subunit
MLTIHRAERTDRLVEALASVLVEPLDDPFTTEVVAVPTRGVERWLAQRLSTVLGTSAGRQDGVCANVDFPFPGRLIGGALAAATGLDPEHDPWLPERLVWPLLSVVDEHLDDGWLATLAAHIGGAGPEGDGSRRDRRFGALRRVADRFDHYGVHRPAMIEAWALGQDTDGHDRPLPPDQAWQPPLWRALRRRLATPSPAERLRDACARLADDPAILALPPRLALFGLTRLPASFVDVLSAIAVARDVNLFLLHPSPALWDRLAARPPTGNGRGVQREDDTTATMPQHPLLATWGNDAREMQLVVEAAGNGQRTDRHHELPGPPPTTLLHLLQADIRADRLPPGPPAPGRSDERVVVRDDDTIQVHACHGRSRQVEVVRDAILHLLADDPTLEPRDVIVMCPDIEAYAPLIQATFGSVDIDADIDAGVAAPPPDARLPDLRVQLADRSLRQTNPVLATVAELLELAATRVTASQVIDFASRDPVRRRFRLDDDDLDRLETWVAATGVRWGFDAAHRAPYRLDAIGANTWRSGLDRVLLGVTMAEDELRLVGGVLPLNDVDSGSIELAGTVAELVDRLEAAVAELSRSQPLTGWARAIATAADRLTMTSERDEWQRRQLDRLLQDVVAEAGDAAADPAIALSPSEIRAVLADRLRGRPTRANFRTGNLTVCTLVPMRSVPHRVVCLLGLDDGTFPRRTAPDGDDIIERSPCVGDRDPRREDRQLLLDALLAATDHLVVTYAGRDERTNATRPPAVPLGELLDVIDRTARTADGKPARQCVLVEHPLQTFDARNFVTGGLVPRRRWSFDAVVLAGARASAGERVPAPPFLDGPLPAANATSGTDTTVVELADLVSFVQHPVKAFLRQRLGTSVRAVDDEPADGLPVELGSLETWDVGQRLLEQRLAGLDLDACLAAERVRGVLPLGSFGDRIVDGVLPTIEVILTTCAAAVDPTAEAASLEVNVDLGDGRSVVGSVPDVLGDVVRTVSYSRLAPKQRIGAWVRSVALAAAHPERSVESVTLGRGRPGRCAIARIPVMGRDARSRRRLALDQLRVLVDLYLRGMLEPLPLYCKTSAAYAAAAPDRRVDRARSEWETSGGRFDKEDREPEHQLVLGGVVPLDDLLVAKPLAAEAGLGWADDETSRFGRLARRLWDGLLAVEELSNL